MVKNHNKANRMLQSTKNMIFLACDDIEQNLLSQAEKAGKLSLGAPADLDGAK